jgi:hypothetical protein
MNVDDAFIDPLFVIIVHNNIVLHNYRHLVSELLLTNLPLELSRLFPAGPLCQHKAVIERS